MGAWRLCVIWKKPMKLHRNLLLAFRSGWWHWSGFCMQSQDQSRLRPGQKKSFIYCVRTRCRWSDRCNWCRLLATYLTPWKTQSIHWECEARLKVIKFTEDTLYKDIKEKPYTSPKAAHEEKVWCSELQEERSAKTVSSILACSYRVV